MNKRKIKTLNIMNKVKMKYQNKQQITNNPSKLAQHPSNNLEYPYSFRNF